MAKKDVKTLVVDAATLKPLWIKARELAMEELKKSSILIVKVENTKVPVRKQAYRLGHHDLKAVPGIRVEVKDNQLHVTRAEA